MLSPVCFEYELESCSYYNIVKVHSVVLFLPSHTKLSNSLCFHEGINKLTLKDMIDSVSLTGGPCHPSSFSVLGPYCPQRTAGLFTDEKYKYFWVC